MLKYILFLLSSDWAESFVTRISYPPGNVGRCQKPCSVVQEKRTSGSLCQDLHLKLTKAIVAN